MNIQEKISAYLNNPDNPPTVEGNGIGCGVFYYKSYEKGKANPLGEYHTRSRIDKTPDNPTDADYHIIAVRLLK